MGVTGDLIGRDAELEQLRALLDRARSGAGGAAVVVAEPGGGKTSLVAAAVAEAGSAGMGMLWGTGSAATTGVPWLPVSEALNNGLAGVDADALRRRLGPRHRLAALVAPALFPEQAPPLVEEGARAAVFDALLGVLMEFSAGQGVVLVLDDLQWADATSQQLMSHLAARAGHLRLALLLTWRDTGDHPVLSGLLRQPGVVAVRPRPLDRADLTRLAHRLLGAAPRADVLAQVAERSAGNAFAATELLLALSRGDDAEHLPASVREAVLGRARGLRPADERVLRAASVLEREFEAALIARLGSRSREAVTAAFGRLASVGLLERAGGGRHRFRHALIAGAVRSEMDAGSLREAHAAAAAALGSEGAPTAELAHHLFAAGRDSEAVPLALEAAEAAERAGANVEASFLFERAAATHAEAGERGDLLDRAAFNALVAFQVDRARDLAERSVALLVEGGRPAARARATYSQTLARESRLEEAEAQRRLALAEVTSAPPSAFTAHVLMMLAAQLMALWQPEEAIGLAERSVSAADAAGDERTSVMARAVIATCMGLLGHLDEAIRLTDDAAEWGFQHRLYMPTLAAVNNAAQLRTMALRGREAIERLQNLEAERRALLAPELHRVEAGVLAFVSGPDSVLRAIEDASVTASPSDLARLALQRALALVELDRAPEALDLIGRTVSDPGVVHVRLRVQLQAQVAAGATTGAAAAASELLALPQAFAFWALGAEAAAEALIAAGGQGAAAAALRERRGEADEENPWWRLGWARVDVDADPEAAWRWAAAAAERFQAAGYPWDAGRANLVLAAAMLRAGDREAARATLHRVLATAKEHGIRHHARLARDKLAVLGDPADRLDAAAVRVLLERLHSLPPEQRERLLGAVEQLVAAGGREGEAGTIVRDYYVKKVGSQEVVAERHYLTRPTFYRRLHLGWELLASRLGPLDGAPTGSAREN